MQRNFEKLCQSTRASLLTRVSSLTDAEAWHEFCGMYGPLIHATARRCGLQPTDCDDVAQAVFASIVRSMPRFVYDRQRGRFRAYLKTVTLHTIARMRRHSGGRFLGAAAETVCEPSMADDLESAWESEWRQYHIRRAMHRVRSEFSAESMEAFRRYAIQNVKPQQVAQELGLTTHQVYKAKTRILQRMREIVREQIALEP